MNTYWDDELVHSRKGWEKKKHKYLSKEWRDGKLRYIYDKASSLDKKITDRLNKNTYITDESNYKEKVDNIKKNDPEWKKIVNEKNPEYVKKAEDGTVKYDIDKYLLDKKHPLLDAASDIYAGRKIETRNTNKETAVAGAYDYTFAVGKHFYNKYMLKAGAMAAAIYNNQGSLKDEKDETKKAISNGLKLAKSILANITPEDIENITKAAKAYSSAASSYSKTVSDNPDKYINEAKKIAKKNGIQY